MNNYQELELNGILRFGLTYDKISSYDVICLPENISNASNKNELFDSPDAITLVKLLKAQRIKCANSLDLEFDPQILERRSREKWFGVVYLRNNVVIPIFVSVLGTLLAELISESIKSSDTPIPKVHIELKIEKSNNVTTLKYDGDAKTLLIILNNLENSSTNQK